MTVPDWLNALVEKEAESVLAPLRKQWAEEDARELAEAVAKCQRVDASSVKDK